MIAALTGEAKSGGGFWTYEAKYFGGHDETISAGQASYGALAFQGEVGGSYTLSFTDEDLRTTPPTI